MSQFVVNHKSIPSFFIQNQMSSSDIIGLESIHLKKDCGITTENEVVFYLFDKPQYSNTRLQNIYTYRVLPYDSISIKLELVSFDVQIVEVVR